MTLNTYVRNGSVVRCDDGLFKATMLYGEKKFDPRMFGAALAFHMPPDCWGRPHEIVLHIAGETYYPTTDQGYVKL